MKKRATESFNQPLRPKYTTEMDLDLYTLFEGLLPQREVNELVELCRAEQCLVLRLKELGKLEEVDLEPQKTNSRGCAETTDKMSTYLASLPSSLTSEERRLVEGLTLTDVQFEVIRDSLFSSFGGSGGQMNLEVFALGEGTFKFECREKRTF